MEYKPGDRVLVELVVESVVIDCDGIKYTVYPINDTFNFLRVPAKHIFGMGGKHEKNC